MTGDASEADAVILVIACLSFEVNTVYMATFSYHHGDLSAALIAAGVEALEDEGSPALSLRALARKCGATPAAAYRHFSSKGALLDAIAAAGFADLVERFGAKLEPRTSVSAHEPTADLVAFGQVYVQFARDRPAMFRLMFGGGYESEEPVGANARPGGQAFGMLRAAASRAIGKPENDPAVLRSAVRAWSLVHGYAMLDLDGRLPAEAEDESFFTAMLESGDTER